MLFGKKKRLAAAVFDPDSAASGEAGVFGLPHTPDQAKVIVIPVPFEATTSYGAGTSEGPSAVFEASKQVDLYDHETGHPYQDGIAMLDVPRQIERWNREAKDLAGLIIDVGGEISSRRVRKSLKRVNDLGDLLNEWVYEQTRALLEQGKMPVVLGGDHSVPFGAIRAYSEAYPGLGILHVDAHADLREAYEGFTWSHASIFHNVMTRLPQVSKLVQVGIRDLGVRENEMIIGSAGRIVAFHDADIADRLEKGEPFATIADEVVSELPRVVYLSWDIDGLDPSLCPGTGTPVPGGLSWQQAIGLLRALKRAGKRIVGLDLCEVSPGMTEWDANVGARLLYKMIGFALASGSRPE